MGQRTILGLENLEAVWLILLNRSLKTRLKTIALLTGCRVRGVGELRLGCHTDLVGGLRELEFTGLDALVQTTGGQVGISIVDTTSNMNTIDWGYILHSKARHLTRLLKVCLNLCLPRITASGLGTKEGTRFLLTEKGVLSHTRILVE